ncbi:MAG: hypothetical protein JW841_03920 [Deltaproteobacteria bacterium]|nr:hypothetical protein [Deltaproteobacteria bacterium]
MRSFGLWPLLSTWFLLASCSSTPLASLYGQQQNITAKDYRTILTRWTRSDRVYRNFDTKIFVTATLHAPEFRRAFALAFPEIYGHGGTITKRELVTLTGDVEQFHNFFIAVYTPDDKWNDLDQADSIWHLSLIGSNDKVAVDPASIEPIKIDANLREVYPYITKFDKAYLVRFPLTDAMHQLVLEPQSTSATLRIASAIGVAELQWKLISPLSKNEPSNKVITD